MKIYGQHLIIDLINLDRSTCLDGEGWIKAFIKSSVDMGLEVISSYHHSFKPPKLPGITAYVLLDSSHFSIHTYAESGEAALDLFACTDKDLAKALTKIQEIMGINGSHIAMQKETRRFTNGRLMGNK